MSYAADLHVHSRYAYATSRELDFDNLALYARIKGIDLLASADFTHPDWFEESRRRLNDTGTGLFEYDGTSFILGTEVGCHGKQGDRSRRVHVLVFAPEFEAAKRINTALSHYGRLDGDGRPALGCSRATCSSSSRASTRSASSYRPTFGRLGSGCTARSRDTTRWRNASAATRARFRQSRRGCPAIPR